MAIAVVLSILACWVLVALNAHERFTAFASRYEQWQLDEMLLLLLVVYTTTAWFSARRWRESREEVASRIEAENHISQLLLENQRLFHHSLSVQEVEKRNIARELHDELGQYLTATRAESVALRLASNDLSTIARASAIESSIMHIQFMARNIISRLRPPALDVLGLSAALEQLVNRQCEAMNLHDFQVDIQRKIDEADENIAINAYRIAQECLTNIVKHSGAKKISFKADITQQGLIMLISDDGIGFSTKSHIDGFGLVGIRERIDALKGQLEIYSEPQCGVRISVTLPLVYEND